jgi:hypothetical protein
MGAALRASIWDQLEAAEWEPYVRLLWTRVQLIDGTTTRALYLMKRLGPDGNWQYRRMTDEEQWKYMPLPPTG